MSPDDAQVFELAGAIVASVPALYAILLTDERRLTGARLDRAWPPASRDAAICLTTVGGAFVPFVCVAVHFFRTRRGMGGLALGLAWGVGFFLFENVVAFCVAAAIDGLGL